MVEGFPWDRLQAAQKLLYAIKPWWARFGGRMKIVPIDIPAPPGEKYGGITSTDADMNLYIDSSFVASSPIEEIAGAVEKELQYHVRDAWRRLLWLSEEDYSRYFNICMDLEINSVINRESTAPSDVVSWILDRSSVFTSEMASKWMVRGAPSIMHKSWLPELLGMPDGLSAEQYYRILSGQETSPTPGDDNEDGEEERESQDSAGGDSESSGDSGTEDGEGEPESGEGESSSGEPGGDEPSDDADEGSDPDTEDEPSSDSEGQPDEGDENKEPDEGQGGDEGTDTDQSDQGQESSEPGNPEQGDDESPSDTNDDADDQGDSESDSDAEDGGQDQSTDQPGSEQSGSDSQPQSESQQTPSQRMAELKRNDPDLAWWAMDKSSMQQKAEEDEDSDTQEMSEFDISQAHKEIAEDVKEGSLGRSFAWGLSPDERLMNWAYDQRRKHSLDCWSLLSKAVSRTFDSVKIKGMSDLSYSVPNPNQSPIGPILMGLLDYAPKTYLVQDISGSMAAFMQNSLDVFRKVLKTTSTRFGAEVTWFTVDTKIVDTGSLINFNPSVTERFRRGFGGTVLEQTLDDMARGKLRWNGKKFARPDVILLSTDCLFKWPWLDLRKPPAGTQVIVLSVTEWDDLSKRMDLPKWLVPGKNFIYVDE